LAALEALACEVPVVATSVGGLPEVVDHGKTGFLFPVGDVDSMAEATIDLLTDEEKRAQFGREARRQAVDRFREETVVERYRDVYRRALGQQ